MIAVRIRLWIFGDAADWSGAPIIVFRRGRHLRILLCSDGRTIRARTSLSLFRHFCYVVKCIRRRHSLPHRRGAPPRIELRGMFDAQLISHYKSAKQKVCKISQLLIFCFLEGSRSLSGDACPLPACCKGVQLFVWGRWSLCRGPACLLQCQGYGSAVSWMDVLRWLESRQGGGCWTSAERLRLLHRAEGPSAAHRCDDQIPPIESSICVKKKWNRISQK